ncbi:MAG TPA: class I SAM-dependent methyltransferase, partial [Burkholderiaceae bacterium]|nr:class I SAM-dependent methyltransferase [Burkholderiaceae bacterium]
ELGFGAGLNLPHFDASKVRKLYALEPSQGMVKRARDRVRNAPFDVEIERSGDDRNAAAPCPHGGRGASQW